MTKILLCEDDKNVREAVTHYLSAYGMEVDGMAQSEEVLERLKAKPYDLLICNAWQDAIDGFSLCRKVRMSEDSRLQATNVLMVAFEPFGHDEYRELRKQKIHFMTKYRGPEKWYEKIATILNC